MGKIYLLANVGGRNPELAPHFFKHYRDLGVDDFLVVYNDDPELSKPEFDMEAVFAEYGVSKVDRWVGRWTNAEKGARLDAIRVKHVEPGSWIIRADMDEFQVYPEGDLRSFLERTKAAGYDHVAGHFVDRVAEAGFPSIRPDVPIGAQFPLRADISGSVCGAATSKICAALDYVAVAGSHFHYVIGAGWRCSPVDVEVHHFKWDASVFRWLEKKKSDPRTYGLTALESLRFLNWTSHNFSRL